MDQGGGVDAVTLLLDAQLVVSATLAVATAVVGSYWYSSILPPALMLERHALSEPSTPRNKDEQDANDASDANDPCCSPAPLLGWYPDEALEGDECLGRHYSSPLPPEVAEARQGLQLPLPCCTPPSTHSVSVGSCLDTMCESPKTVANDHGGHGLGWDIPTHRLSLDACSIRMSLDGQYPRMSTEHHLMTALCSLSPALNTHRLSLDESSTKRGRWDNRMRFLPFNPLRRKRRWRPLRSFQIGAGGGSATVPQPWQPPVTSDGCKANILEGSVEDEMSEGSVHSESSIRLADIFTEKSHSNDLSRLAYPVSREASGGTALSAPGALLPQAKQESSSLTEWLFGVPLQRAASLDTSTATTTEEQGARSRSHSFGSADFKADADAKTIEPGMRLRRSFSASGVDADTTEASIYESVLPGRRLKRCPSRLQRIISGQHLNTLPGGNAGPAVGSVREEPDSFAVAITDSDLQDSPAAPMCIRHRGRMTVDSNGGSFRMRTLASARPMSASLDLCHSASEPLLSAAQARASCDVFTLSSTPISKRTHAGDNAPTTPRPNSPSITSALTSYFWPAARSAEVTAMTSLLYSPISVIPNTTPPSDPSTPPKGGAPPQSSPSALSAHLRHMQEQQSTMQATQTASQTLSFTSYLWSASSDKTADATLPPLTKALPKSPLSSSMIQQRTPASPVRQPMSTGLLQSHALLDTPPSTPSHPHTAPGQLGPRHLVASDAAQVVVNTPHGTSTGCALDAVDTLGTTPCIRGFIPDQFLVQLGEVLGEEVCEAHLKTNGLPPSINHPDSLLGVPSDPTNAASCSWQLMLDESDPVRGLTYTAEKRLLRQGHHVYRTSTLFHDCTAAELRRFNLDDDLNLTWNVNTVEYTRLAEPEDSVSTSPPPQLSKPLESGLMYMRCRFPGLFCEREYVSARRVWHRSADGGCYVVTIARPIEGADSICKHRTFRVVDYVSAFVIRDVQTARGPAVELKSVYFESPGVPPLISNMAIQKGLWGAVQGHAKHFHAFVDALGAPDKQGDPDGAAVYLASYREALEQRRGGGGEQSSGGTCRRLRALTKPLARLGWVLSGVGLTLAHGAITHSRHR